VRIEGQLAVVAPTASQDNCTSSSPSSDAACDTGDSNAATTTTANTNTNSTITTLSAANLTFVGANIQIPATGGTAAPALKTVSLPRLRAAGAVHVLDLPALDTLDLGVLDRTTNRGLTVAAVPALYYLDLPLTQAGSNVSVAGNGNLVVQLGGIDVGDDEGGGDNTIQAVPNLDLAGLGELRWRGAAAQGGGKAVVVEGQVAVHDGRLTTLPLLFDSVSGLEVRDNGELTDILFPENSTWLVSRLRSVVVTGNGALDLTTIHNATWNGTQMQSWVWPGEDLNTVILNGTVHIAFLWVSYSSLYLDLRTPNATLSPFSPILQVTLFLQPPSFYKVSLDTLNTCAYYPSPFKSYGTRKTPCTPTNMLFPAKPFSTPTATRPRRRPTRASRGC
jgi:hypothetical protein